MLTLNVIAHLAVFAGLALTAYLGTCALFPYKVCRSCGGRGHHRAFLGVRYCPTCRGEGLLLRPGAEVLHGLRRRRQQRRRNHRDH